MSHDNCSLLRSWAGSRDHDEVSFDLSVVYPSSERVDPLICGVELGSAAVELCGSVDHQDLLVWLGSVERTHLTCTADCVLDVGWVPRSNAGYLPVTTSGLALQVTDVPTHDDAFKPATASD